MYILNIKCASVWSYLCGLCSTKGKLKAQFVKKLSNTGAELKKSVVYKKSMYLYRINQKYERETSVAKLKLAAETFYVHSFAALLY